LQSLQRSCDASSSNAAQISASSCSTGGRSAATDAGAAIAREHFFIYFLGYKEMKRDKNRHKTH
jgi:hypothetical protein